MTNPLYAPVPFLTLLVRNSIKHKQNKKQNRKNMKLNKKILYLVNQKFKRQHRTTNHLSHSLEDPLDGNVVLIHV